MLNSVNNQNLNAIKSVVEDYFEGYLKADPHKLHSAFHISARLLSTDAGALEKTEMSDWLTDVTARQKKGDLRQAVARIDGVDISGDAAIVKTSITFSKFKFTDYLSLLHVEKQWKIVNKIYTATDLEKI